MIYTDLLFLVIFALVWAVCRLLRPWPAVKEWFLIAFSLLVIATWGLFDLGLFLTVLLYNYGAVRRMTHSAPRPSRVILAASITLNIAVLAAFKYANFLGDNLSFISGWKFSHFPLGIPLAISFYTFHLISYLVDVHAGKVHVATFRQYLFYLSFFPHVIAGPIVRAWQLVPQIGRIRRVRTDTVMGVHFLVIGFFLKMVMANRIGHGIDRVWAGDSAVDLTAADRWAVAFLYYCQIYGDFAGYTLMALGMSRLLGYRLPVNFRGPMRATTMQEFWQRWHITLSRWLRDYLYIPLGGNRASPTRASVNVMITMLLGGLWHGAGWGFVIWGGMQGIGIVIQRALGMRSGGLRGAAWLGGLLFTQLWVTSAWVFFRAPDFPTALGFFLHLFWFTTLHSFSLHRRFLLVLIWALPVVAHNWAPLLLRKIPRRRLGLVLGIGTGVVLVLNIIIYSPSAVFIYFTF